MIAEVLAMVGISGALEIIIEVALLVVVAAKAAEIFKK